MAYPVWSRTDDRGLARFVTGDVWSEGMSLDAFLELLIDEREELTEAIERADAHLMPLSEKQIEAKIERGLLQSERGEVVDGDAFTAGLLSEITEMERKRQVG